MSCSKPIKVKGKKGILPAYGTNSNTVPCGKCYQCYLRRVQGWVFRLLEEFKHCYTAEFVCLTYNDRHLPRTARGVPTLSKGRHSDLSKFFKRLRINIERDNEKRGITKRPDLKYYACGEYGTKRWRPHYHLIIFNVTREEILKAWKVNGDEIGYVNFGDKPADLFNPQPIKSNVTSDSIAYCCKYICKPDRIKKGDSRVREFSVMSKHLGLSYLTPQMIKYHKAGLKSFVVVNGFKQALPRYYRDKIFTEEEREAINLQVAAQMSGKLLQSWREYGYMPALAHDDYENWQALKNYEHVVNSSHEASIKNMASQNKRDAVG